MPQLDSTQFSSQLVWLALSFLALYFGLSRYILPRLSDLLLERRTRIANDVDEAELLDKDRSQSLQRAEAVLADARRAGEAQLQETAQEASQRADEAFAQKADAARREAQAASDTLDAQQRAAHDWLAAASCDLAASLLHGALSDEGGALAQSPRLAALTKDALARTDAADAEARHA